MMHQVVLNQFNQTPTERLIGTLGLDGMDSIALKRADEGGFEWTASVDVDGAQLDGRANSPEEALIEVALEWKISQWYYASDGQTDLRMQEIEDMRDKLYASVGLDADGAYRGAWIGGQP